MSLVCRVRLSGALDRALVGGVAAMWVALGGLGGGALWFRGAAFGRG